MSMFAVTDREAAIAELFGPDLEPVGESIAAWMAQRRNVFVYFDNDQKAAAPGDARRLTALLRGSASDIRNR